MTLWGYCKEQIHRISRRWSKHICVIFVVMITTLLIYMGYISYDNAYPGRNLKEIIQDEPCSETLGKTQEEDIQKIKSYPLQEADKYLRDFVPVLQPEIIFKNHTADTVEIPVIVSGASGNHMHEVVAFFNSLNALVRPAYPTAKVYFFDLGLTSSERTKVQQLCNCITILFPFERYPPHVRRLNSYCWKPIIIAMMLRTYQFVLWLDSSIQFQTSDLDSLFSRAKEKGVIAKYDGLLLPSHTHQDTYSFLQEIPCVFRNSGEFSASFILFHTGNKIIRDYFIKPWVACALIEDCMRTKHDELKLLPCRTHQHYHACHRYDQAVFGLLLFRLFHDTYKEHDLGNRTAKWCRELDCL